MSDDTKRLVSVILNAVKDLALELLHILCEILRVAQNEISQILLC